MQTLESIAERRPMFTREWNLSKWLARGLATHSVSPNTISIVGMWAGIAAGAALAATRWPAFERLGYLLAALGIVVRALGNLLDGMVAVETGKASRIGELYNEIPDRASDIAMLVGAGFSMGGSPELGLAAAILAVFVAYVRAQGKVSGAPQDYCGPMSKPGRILVIVAVCLLGAAMPQAMKPAIGIRQFSVMNAALAFIIAGSVLTIHRRLKRIVSALRRNERLA